MVEFRRFTPTDIPLLEGWFEDAELRRRLSPPTGAWVAHVLKDSAARVWIAAQAGLPVGLIQVDGTTDGPGAIALGVAPNLRGKGVGTRVLRAFCEGGPGAVYTVLTGAAEADNTASLICAHRAGFVVSEEFDADGLIPVTRSRA